MTGEDPRKSFILNALVNYFDTHETNLEKLFYHPSVNTFLDNGNARLLLASTADNGEILLCNEVDGLKPAKKAFVFLKIAPLPITDENFSKLIMIASLQGGAAQSFYNSLDRLYGPLMMKNESKMMHQFPRLKLALSDLVLGLAACTKSSQDKDDQIPNVIFDLASEADYWLQKSRSSPQGMNAERIRSESIYKTLKPAVDATQRLELQAICTRQPMEWTTDRESQARPEHRQTTNAEEFLCSLSEALETSIIDCLDGVWRLRDVAPPYPESRMRSLLEAVGGWLSRILISYLNPLHSEETKVIISPLWDRPFKQVKIQLERGIQLCEQWEKSCLFFTQQLWARESTHRWENEPPQLTYLQEFKKRMIEVLHLRANYEELLRILSSEERGLFRLAEKMSDFLLQNQIAPSTNDSTNVLSQLVCNPLAYNPFTAEQWSVAVKCFNDRIHPAEEAAIPYLRNYLATAAQKSGQNVACSRVLFAEFKRYRELLRRPLIRQALQTERENLLGYISVGVKGLREEFLHRTADQDFGAGTNAGQGHITHGKNIPDQVERIIWAGQLEAKSADHLKLAETVLADLDGFAQLKQEVVGLIKDVSAWRKDQFDTWCRTNQSALSAEEGGGAGVNEANLLFDPSKCLLHLSATDGRLQVGYPDGLLRLQREVRLLSGFGYPVPSKLHKVAAHAEQMYKHAIVLKQVAHFYNSIDSQMIPSQQALMLKSALAFERLVKFNKLADPHKEKVGGEGTGITWQQAKEVPAYINQLQMAVRHLIEENRQLRMVHYELTEQITSLMNVDLLRQQSKWREVLMTMRCRLAEVASAGGYPADHMTPWRAHLDRQLYKALEVQYRFGLESLNERMPEMRVDLVYQQSNLTLQPPFEEIKARYYKEMKKFIGIPCHFRGVGEFNETKADGSKVALIFPMIIENQSAGFRVCYRKAEFLFARLAASIERFRDWVALGNVNLDDLVDVECRAISDYENNFRAIKRRGRAAEELPNEIRIDCFTVNCIPVKNTIEQLLQNLFDALLNCLRRSVQADLVAADAFLTDALEKLSQRPQTVEEMSEATARHAELAKGQARLTEQLNWAEEKDRLLKNVSGAGVGALATTRAKWDKFQLMMESFKLMMNEQIEVLKSNMESRMKVFFGNLEKFAARWYQLRPSTEILHSGDRKQCLDAVQVIRSRKEEFGEMEETLNGLLQDCKHFDISPPNCTLAEELRNNFFELETMWSVYEKFALELEELCKEDWISFRSRTYLFEEFLSRWFDQLRSEQPTSITALLMREIDQYKELLPALKWVRGEALSADHWIELFRLVGLPRTMLLENLTFGDILSVAPAIMAQAENLKNLIQRAQSEVLVREALQELDVWGAGAVFSLTAYIDSRKQRVPLITDWKNVVTQVGDNQALLASLQGSPYFGSFADRANAWGQRLADLDACLLGMQAVQRRWVYLEPIFGSGALTREAGRFNRVDVEFRSLLAGIEQDNRVVSLVNGRRGNELRDKLTTMQDQLSRCQRALNDFLEEKRNLFPRFYFLGDDDLLEILGQSSNPNVIQAHLRKLFQAVHNVIIESADSGPAQKKPDSRGESFSITDICSPDGERVSLKHPILVANESEKWLSSLETEMRTTLSSLLSECLNDRVNPSIYPGQILALREAIQFSAKAEKAITTGRLTQLQHELQATLKNYADANMKCSMGSGGESGDGPQDELSTSVSRVASAKLITLILDTGHRINVVAHLIKQNTASVHDWAWQRQLRFYSQRTGSRTFSSVAAGEGLDTEVPCVRMVDAEFAYTFEYQGNAPRLVHTPLTDKCYLTLTQAMRMGLGGNPYGPAGTGKTESVKQLGGLLGRQVLVFNCDEGIDVQSMGRIFVGLVKCGAWGCFDEFNRLEEVVLSAVSMQIQVIQNGLRSGATSVELLGHKVSLSPNSGIFITMNPAGKGYGGRQKLPDNLKQLFRPVAMTKPDDELIAETLLFSQGFTHSRDLGRKLVAVFSLSKQLLSDQQHYDWGLRALKTVLKHAGNLLHQKNHASSENANQAAGITAGQADSLALEARLVIQSVRNCSIAKLTYVDAAKFDALLRDVFPDPEQHSVDENDDMVMKLTAAMHEVLTENQLVLVPRQIEKALEVFSQLRQRMGVVIVGPSGCGKSTVLKLLWLALQKIGIRVNRHILNPKAMPRFQLLGRIDPDTRGWTDGVLTRSARDLARESSDTKAWIVCDGDIDPEWVESLNSVLDDNRLLTLPNGERIQFGANINFLFETHELTCASPATVSRMGVIFISDEMLDARALVEAWLLKQPEEHKAQLGALIHPNFYTCLEWVRKRNECLIGTSYAGTILNGLSHLVGATTCARFTVGLIRGLGANLPESTKSQLALKVCEVMGEHPPDPTHPLNIQVDPNSGTRLVTYPHGVRIVFSDRPTSLENDAFASTGDVSADSDPTLNCNAISSLKPPLVITPHVRCAMDSFRCWLEDARAQQSFLLIGPEGCGKSMLLEYCMASSKRATQVALVQCAAQTRPSHVLEKLMQYCITVTSTNTMGSSGAGRVLRPKEGDRLILFLRDLNLPKPDKWGSCELTAFLQQLLTYKGFYDSTTLDFIGVEGIQVVATLTPTTTAGMVGRYALTPRLTSILRIASITSPDREELNNIYHSILQMVCSTIHMPQETVAPSRASGVEGRSRLHALASTMVQAWLQLEQTFRANKYPHCTFSLRDLTRLILAFQRYEITLTPESTGADIWLFFGYEARRLFRDRLPGEEHRFHFDRLFSALLHGTSENEEVLNGWSSGINSSTAFPSKTLIEASLASRFATGEPIMDQLDGENSGPRGQYDLKTLEKGQYWFATWGSKSPLVPGVPVAHCGRPLGLVSYASMQKLASQGLKQLARESSVRTGDIVLFPDFLDLIARIDRVLSRPAGSLLLCGRCGIGRRSAIRLVAHLHQLPVFTLGVGRGYVTRNLFNDLKAACQSAATENMPTVLLIEEQQLVQDTFLETINSLLACGEAPGLISAEELETMALANGSGGNLHEAAAEAGHQGTLMSFFAKRVHANLHIVIILDIDDSMSLVQRLQANPSLYKHCEVHWLDKWSANSHFLLPRLLVPNLPLNLNKNQFSRACLAIHNGVPYRELASPHRFMILCSTYQHLESEHRGKLESQIGRLRAGLLKLDEARQHVIQLKATAAEQGKQLTEKQAEADRALAEISAAMQSAGKQRAEMQELQKKSALEASDLEKRKAAIDCELAEIGPILKEAQSAVGSIRPEALSEMRALRAPPDVIRDILEGVLLLMGVRDTSWVSMRSFLARRGVQEEIRNFDARKISRELRLSVEQLLKRSADSFTARAARRASVAAAPLAAWVQANVQFASVLERIAPLEEEQSRLTRSLEATEVALSQLEHELNSVDSRVAELRNTFESHTKAAADLRLDLSKANNTLTVAENLVAELEGEHTRWNNQVSTLSETMEALPATTLVSAGFITYLSACSEDVREKTVTNWWEQLDNVGLKIPAAYMGAERKGAQQSMQSHHHFDLRRFLTTEKEMLQWKSQGLPSDQLSGENAVVILKSRLCPFIIDPSRRCVDWLKKHMKSQSVEVADQQSTNFVTRLELAVRFGKILIVQEVDQIEAILFPLLKADLSLQGPRATVKIGEKNVDFNEEFRLFMTTRQPPSSVGAVLPVCASSLVTVVNFQTTRAGLVGQLLEISLQHERAELEARRQELLKGEEDKKMELAQLEDNLLEELANARGNILENTDLLESLNKTKATSIKVMQSLTEFERLQAELESEREEFRHLAEGGSKVFFAMKDLVRINRMYQFSLKSFINLFRRALDTPQDESLGTEKKLSLLLKRLETLAVEYVSRALFKVDRLMFAMHITYCLRSNCITSQEWEYFINGPTSDCKVDTDRLPNWVPVDRTIAMCNLKAGQPDLYERLLFDNEDVWSRWMTSRDAEEGRLPAALSDLPLTPFQVLLVIQALRPAELQRSMKQFAKKCLGLPHLTPSSVSLQRLYNTETRAEEPILIIISPGADPSQELAEAAQASIGKGNYHEVAMGQGQADLALSEITSAAESGSWVCLKNLHLVTFWLPILEKHINTIFNLAAERADGDVDYKASNGPKLHPNFRLWLTTEPQQTFPSTLLQSCLKVTYEAPPGLRNNLKRTYESWNTDYVAKGNSVSRATALASLAWFHAVLQERRGFLPQGWTKFYEFSFVDIRAAANIIDRLFAPSTSTSAVGSGIWKSIKGLLNNAIYGGRMDNTFDVKVLETFLDQIFSETTIRTRQLGSFTLPGTTNVRDYVTAIDQLPDVDLPVDLGLPANIGKTAQLMASTVALGQLRELQRNIDQTAFCDRALWSKELSPVLILWKKLNHDGSLLPNKDSKIRATLAKIEEKSLKDPKESPVLSFLHREMSDTLTLISNIHQNLGHISKILRGTHALTQGVDVIIQSLLRGETPASWLECWSAGPEDYSNFLNVLMRKASALQKWIARSEVCVSFLSPETAFDLADLLNPAIFLNAVRQQTARQSKVPIDELKLVSKWPCSKLPQKTFGAQSLRITGLQLEGACFEGGKLADCRITSPTITELPELILEWTPETNSEPLSVEDSISLPVYFDTRRCNLVTKIKVPCQTGSQQRWIQNGVALFVRSF